MNVNRRAFLRRTIASALGGASLYSAPFTCIRVNAFASRSRPAGPPCRCRITDTITCASS